MFFFFRGDAFIISNFCVIWNLKVVCVETPVLIYSHRSASSLTYITCPFPWALALDVAQSLLHWLRPSRTRHMSALWDGMNFRISP
jgi:hypothetical protein